MPTDARDVKPLNVMFGLNVFDSRGLMTPRDNTWKFSTISISDLETWLKTYEVKVTSKETPDVELHIQTIDDLQESIQKAKTERQATFDKIAELKKEIEKLEKTL